MGGLAMTPGLCEYLRQGNNRHLKNVTNLEYEWSHQPNFVSLSKWSSCLSTLPIRQVRFNLSPMQQISPNISYTSRELDQYQLVLLFSYSHVCFIKQRYWLTPDQPHHRVPSHRYHGSGSLSSGYWDGYPSQSRCWKHHLFRNTIINTKCLALSLLFIP